ncbi:MAG: hypothetical protein ACQCN5_01455 [Candidatus Bathyarchaeia archaeon]|jgi:outer membrane protein assembly factor BamB
MGKKLLSSALAMLFVVSMAISLFPQTNIAEAAPAAVATYPFVEAIPNPVGVNQRTLINLGLLNYLNTDGDGWNVTLEITHPDGHLETVGPLKTWSTGTVGYSFVPESTGTYMLKCKFEESWYNSSYIGWFGPVTTSNYMASSETEPYELVVTEEPTSVYPGHSLPTEYWTRPIDSQLREWWSVAGSWVAAPPNLIAEYNDAPNSAHILWTTPIGETMGGLTGGDTRDHGYGTGDAYEGKWSGEVIISGVLYYNKYSSASPQQAVVAIDLHTGEKLWEKSFAFGNGRLSFGQILYWDCLNYRGAFSYLWIASGSGTEWYGVEPLTGDLKYNMTNVPSGTNYYGENGEILKYSISNGRLLRWNSSYVVTQGKTGMSESWGSQTLGVTYNATQRGYDINVSITGNLPSFNILKVFPGDRVIGGNSSAAGVTLWGISLASGSVGTVLFSNTWTAPSTWKDITIDGMGQAGWGAFSKDEHVAIFWTKENRINYAFSLDNGQFLWQTEPQIYSDAWGSVSYDPEKLIAYGNLYSATVGGILYCYDIQDGTLKWTFEATDKYTESYLGNNWWLVPTFLNNGKIYLGHMEHSSLDPKPRGAPFYCVNATDGSLIWEIDGGFRQSCWGGRAIMGDGIIATQDTYTQQVYAIGRGPSQTTVETAMAGVTVNSQVVIAGTVMDVSPGTTSSAISMRFPNGVPAVSDESMSNWMLYVYKQFEQPSTMTGVTVSIDAVDPNGNYVHLGDATTDSSGYYSIVVQPELEGTYRVYATFGGTAGYYSSYAETTIAVQQAAQPSQTTQQINFDAINTTIMTGLVATGIAIIIAIAIAVMLLRKRP